MNKKLLFAAMSLVALTACTDNDFESQQKMAEEVSPVQFEIVNNAFTRADMGGDGNNTIVWSANDKDLFTLYHGSAVEGFLSGYDNATYMATPVEGSPAILTTPTMIKEGEAIMVWPVDTTFRIQPANNLSIVIPATQKKTEDEIPYVSDRITIGSYIIPGTETTAERPSTEADFNRAGYNRKYPLYLRPMASQLNLTAEYAGTDAEIAKLYKGGAAGLSDDEAIKPIEVTSIDLLTKDVDGTTKFTTKIALSFNEDDNAAWAGVAHNAFSAQTAFKTEEGSIAADAILEKVAKLTAQDDCLLDENKGCKFLILPQPTIAGGVADAAVVVNTIYGKVVVAAPGVQGSLYEEGEFGDAWWRYIKSTTVKEDYETKVTADVITVNNVTKTKHTTTVANGLMQTINAFSKYKAPVDLPVAGEQMGTYADRFVKVLLTHLDMTDLHVKDDKQLRDVVRVWDKLGLEPVTVYLDGNADNEFIITQRTIEVINGINTAKGNANNPLPFKVQPCGIEDHKACAKIVITGSAYKQDIQDVAFIAKNLMGDGNEDDVIADVVFADEGTATPWKWNGDVKVTAAGVSRFINKGTMLNEETATLRTVENDGTQKYVPLINYGTWNIGVEGQTEGTRLNVQFGVTNMGLVTINKKAQYIQDKTTFNNGASTLPERFLAAGVEEKIGEVDNLGVFATVNNGTINNVGLIEHKDVDAKTYITRNQSANAGVNFKDPFGANNKMGTINLPYSNKEEDNISISAELAQGFVSVTISDTPASEAPAGGILNEAVVGHKVNYVNIIGGVTEIQQLPAQIKYVEINEPGTEIVWNLVDDPTTVDNPETEVVENDESVATYEGLIVLSDVNIKLNTTIKVTKACYLGADMYVGGYFNPDKTKAQLKTWDGWNGYYGATITNFESQYITY